MKLIPSNDGFGGNAITKSRPIWELARRNNRKMKRVIIRIRGVIVSKVTGY